MIRTENRPALFHQRPLPSSPVTKKSTTTKIIFPVSKKSTTIKKIYNSSNILPLHGVARRNKTTSYVVEKSSFIGLLAMEAW